jgi:hypothetical protein
VERSHPGKNTMGQQILIDTILFHSVVNYINRDITADEEAAFLLTVIIFKRPCLIAEYKSLKMYS